MYNQYRVSYRSAKGGDGGDENMVLLQETWVHDETIIEALNFLEGLKVLYHTLGYCSVFY